MFGFSLKEGLGIDGLVVARGLSGILKCLQKYVDGKLFSDFPPPPPAVKAVGKQGGGGQINKRQNQLSPGQICQFNNAKCLVCECLCHCVDWSLRKSVISRNNSSSTQRLGLFQSE